MIPQKELNAEDLAQRLKDLSHNREELMRMAKAARSLAIPDSAKRVADICLSLSKVK
jgi:UDP-N-acetylglucosamine--N-acetylmuramyl-(pentapeptide) pyrophosphoryl-undecaprenol N-acetylglucosamine transferase